MSEEEVKNQDSQDFVEEYDDNHEKMKVTTVQSVVHVVADQIGSKMMASVSAAIKHQIPSALPLISMKTLSEDRNSKDSAILTVCVERKKELKAWEDKRTAFITTHRNILQSINLTIEKRMKISQESMAQLVRFFKERKDQESSYSKVFSTKVPHIAQCWKNPNEQQQDWYPQLSQALKETDEFNESLARNVQVLVTYLDTTIIKDLLYNENEEFEKKVKLLRNNILEQYCRLDKAIQKVSKKNASYTQLYTLMMGQDAVLSKKKKQRKDLLNVEIKLRQSAFDHIKEEQDLGQQILTFWEEGRKLECNSQ